MNQCDFIKLKLVTSTKNSGAILVLFNLRSHWTWIMHLLHVIYLFIYDNHVFT